MVQGSKLRIDIVPQRLCQCSIQCSKFVCNDIWNDGSSSKNTDLTVYIDDIGRIQVESSDCLRNSFNSDRHYNTFVEKVRAQATEVIF